MARHFKRFIFQTAFFFALAAVFPQRTSILNGNNDFSIDFPLGFNLVDSNSEGTSFQLQSLVPSTVVTAVVRVYQDGRYDSSKLALEGTMKALGAEYEIEEFEWRNQTSAISSLAMVIGREQESGYALSAVLPEKQGIVVIVTWTPARFYDRAESYMLSLLDSLNIDAGSYYEAGPVTAYQFAKSSEYVPVNLEIDGTKISTRLRANDNEAASYLIEREYAVLSLYAGNSLWKDAWQRYYRMIFRDSYQRLWQASFDIFNEIFPKAKDNTDLAQKLLYWTQNFTYEREKNTSDFAPLPSILLGGGSDCDSRSMLLSVLLTAMNMEAPMLVSAQYGHAMAAITSDHPGHSFEFNGTGYLMGETTSKGLTWGKIDSTQDDQSKWILVEFP
ncbi:MAG: hypothetical protein J5930_10895 [Treponema sp.]|nr:hypothetical protein [Treponema sp.]